MVSVVMGWILVVLGVVSFAGAFVVFFRTSSAAPTRALPQLTDRNLEAVAELLKQISELLGNFGKLSIPVQWALLGLGCIGLGSYLLANRPF